MRGTSETSWAVRARPYRFGLELMLLAPNGSTSGDSHRPAQDLFRDDG